MSTHPVPWLRAGPATLASDTGGPSFAAFLSRARTTGAASSRLGSPRVGRNHQTRGQLLRASPRYARRPGPAPPPPPSRTAPAPPTAPPRPPPPRSCRIAQSQSPPGLELYVRRVAGAARAREPPLPESRLWPVLRSVARRGPGAHARTHAHAPPLPPAPSRRRVLRPRTARRGPLQAACGTTTRRPSS